MCKVVTIKVDQKETIELYKDKDKILVDQVGEEGFSRAAGYLTQQNVIKLIELLESSNQDNLLNIDVPTSNK